MCTFHPFSANIYVIIRRLMQLAVYIYFFRYSIFIIVVSFFGSRRCCCCCCRQLIHFIQCTQKSQNKKKYKTHFRIKCHIRNNIANGNKTTSSQKKNEWSECDEIENIIMLFRNGSGRVFWICTDYGHAKKKKREISLSQKHCLKSFNFFAIFFGWESELRSRQVRFS